MLKFTKIIYIIISAFYSYVLSAAEIIPIDAVPGHYEAEKYLLSRHLVTNLHLAKVDEKRPLLLILGGSNESYTYAPGDWRIKSFLDRGIHVLEAEYFLKPKVGSVPDTLSLIRLESFWEEISEYLKSDKIPQVIDQDIIGVMGTSKGGELALLLASHYPQFKFVVGVVPSHVAFQASNTTLYHYSSWALNNAPVPFVPFSNFSVATIYGVLTRIFCRPDNVNFTWMHSQALTDQQAVENAIIKVEKINGPILLVSGERDQWWPSADMSRKIMARLKEKQFPFSHVHFDRDTDHFPFDREPDLWDKMLSHVDKMIKIRHD
ncbi:MAG TPA: acyl-CoA thioester hydrolase/BAAT C-terminal domain-containing protein [Myxococcota bacterium]|nr:acyl-CoA thioester hydrolase/BAAT C-terminal domain-containing protein [Myxococcota bacterium]